MYSSCAISLSGQLEMSHKTMKKLTVIPSPWSHHLTDHEEQSIVPARKDGTTVNQHNPSDVAVKAEANFKVVRINKLLLYPWRPYESLCHISLLMVLPYGGTADGTTVWCVVLHPMANSLACDNAAGPSKTMIIYYVCMLHDNIECTCADLLSP